MASVDDLLERVRANGERRYVLGIAGGPGAGKSTLADHLTVVVSERGLPVGRAPMDGFHLTNAELERLGRRSRKGAPDTFDVGGYATLLRHIHTDPTVAIATPDFDRDIDEPIAAVHRVEAGPGLVIAEGNYLGLATGGWPAVRAAIDELWFLAVDADERAERCRRRQLRFGATPTQAAAWVRDVDLPNGELVDATRDAADVVLTTTDVADILSER